jgi:hypothetical protein
MKPEGSLLYLKELAAAGSYTEPVESIPYPLILFL